MKKCFVLLLIPFIFSCSSLQQDINIEQVSYSEEIVSFENRFTQIDADSLLPNVDLSEKLQKEQAIDNFIFDIEKAIKEQSQSIQKSSLARLFALEGKAFLIAGKKSKAKDFYEQSVASYKGDTESLILASRLGLFDSAVLEEKSNEVSEKTLLILESAINLFKTKQYMDSVAKFDEAFLSLEEFYRESYGKIRDMAWNLRNVDSESENAELMTLSEINVSQMLKIAKEKLDFLYNLAGGKKMSDKDFFYKISSAGLLNPVSKPLESNNTLGSGDIVTKLVTARFLWNVYNTKKSTNDPTKYSKVMKRSPIPDLDVDSPDFDAVLGCVEKEFMSLEDGINFNGEKNISAVEFDNAVEKVK